LYQRGKFWKPHDTHKLLQQGVVVMKKFLTAIIVLLVISLGTNASAQTPEVKVSFDLQGSEWWTNCPTDLTLDTLTVWSSNMGIWMSAIEYAIEFSPVVTFLEDLPIGDALILGNSQDGISIAYPTPGDAWDWFPTQRIVVSWNSVTCDLNPDSPITIIPHPKTGKIQAVSWHNLALIEATGGTSFICPTLTPTRETTWGNVKSLYK
jgi:hypothetical protein